MADDEEDESGPVVELGEGPAVDGAPLARISSRLHFGMTKSEVVRREGDTELRTPDGPRTVESILDETDETFFPAAEDLREAVEDVVGTGPVPTREREDEESASADEDATDHEGAADGAADEAADDANGDGDEE
jgi:hypothetical protein